MDELKAVWLENPFLDQLNNRKSRITQGDYIPIDREGIITNNNSLTHKVLGCFGDVFSKKIEVMAMCLCCFEIKIIKI